MKLRMLTAALAVPLLGSALGAEEGIAKLQEEVKALRVEVGRLSARLCDDAELGRRLVAIARKLKAGEKIEDGSEDIMVLRAALHRKGAGGYGYGGTVFSRCLGLLRQLPAEQRARLLAEILTDVTASDRSRETALKELALYKDDAARKVIAEACELELLVPPVAAGHSYRVSYFVGKLIAAAAEVDDKRAVDLAIRTLEGTIRAGMTSRYVEKYGISLYGDNSRLAERLARWSDHEGWGQVLAANKSARKWGRAGTYNFKGEAPKQALAELAKVRTWWEANKDKFEFPEEPEPEPEPEPAKPAVELKPIKNRPGERPQDLPERF
ncbi:MAG: hypothetical protein ACYTGB_01885 [Planctomycetota bacterium]